MVWVSKHRRMGGSLSRSTLLLVSALGCGGIADEMGPGSASAVRSTTEERQAGSGGAPADDGASSEGGEAADVVTPALPASDGGEAGAAGAAGAGGHAGPPDAPPPARGCADVCAKLEECAGAPLQDCQDRCESSHWVENHDLRCLALRVYWIDEEGCQTMLEAYEAFEPEDDCSD